MEIYRNINGYVNYNVSNIGNVKNVSTQKILKPYLGKDGYLYITFFDNKKFKLHRLITTAFIENPENKPFVDHKNNNRIDNNILNLRWCTLSENAMNSKKRNTTLVKGVSFHKGNNKWRARISINGVDIHLGYFDTHEEAKIARQIKANEYFGNFTNICEAI